MARAWTTLEGFEAAADIAYRTNEVIAIYPITPSSGMGEMCDQWATDGRKNVWGDVPAVQVMQSEAGVAGVVHGALQVGSLTTTFTCSQGLLLMIPNMYKIAGELTPAVFHVAARSVATNALSIFGDHSDVMATRSTGWSILFSSNVQEAHDMALIAQAVALRSRVPVLHCFDGFRTSHEVQRIEQIPDSVIQAMLPESLIQVQRSRALTPEHPAIRGTAMNPDTYFQAREASNPFYDDVPRIFLHAFRQFEFLTGRRYSAYEYVGDPEATRALVLMGSGTETARETLDHLNASGEKVGMVKVRLFRPFDFRDFIAAIPTSVGTIAVLDRTKEPGAMGEPLFQDVASSLLEKGQLMRVIGGRYGIASKEFTPAMVKAVLDEANRPRPKPRFTVGIHDDVTHLSLRVDQKFRTEKESTTKAVFWGLGADGTVGANKSTIKMIGDQAGMQVQGYFVYDSKKSGAMTVSHLRFGPDPIRSAYLIEEADFVGIHQFHFLNRYPVMEHASRGATILINSPIPAARLWDQLPKRVQEQVLKRDLQLFCIDAAKIARDCGLAGRINTTMQVAFFALAKVIPFDQALECIRKSIHKLYGKRGKTTIEMNLRAVDIAVRSIEPVPVPGVVTSDLPMSILDRRHADDFMCEVIGPIIAGRGDYLPVSAIPADGTFPSGTSQHEKRGIGSELPVWNPDLCIQCGKCVLVCPHAVIRAKLLTEDQFQEAPSGFQVMPAKWKEAKESLFTIQVSADDCTGCTLCVDVCPGVDKKNPELRSLEMCAMTHHRDRAMDGWEFFMGLPDVPATVEPLRYTNVKNVQLLRPLFEFSGACSGCGEAPYLGLLSRLFGDHAVIANATGCSSIFGGNLPTTPWSKNAAGHGPAWSNSLFEDNAEYGLGMHLALEKQRERALDLLLNLHGLPTDIKEILATPAREPADFARKRRALDRLRHLLLRHHEPQARHLEGLADALIDKSVWIVGGDGWAYDIGFGGLDHVVAQGRNVNILVLDTEVYSNTGGQASKSTPLGAAARFAALGKSRPKKDLALMMMGYGNAYVAQIALGANDAHALKVFLEAEAYDGPSLIIALCHCIAHGLDMGEGLQHQKLAVETGYWPLFRFDPSRLDQGLPPLQLDSKAPSRPLREYLETEIRFNKLLRSGDERAEALLAEAQASVEARRRRLDMLATLM